LTNHAADRARAALEQRLGHSFSDPDLVLHALTHGSGKARTSDYQRLEFLGDRVLGLVIAEALFKTFAGDGEGAMSARHSALVRAETCAAVAAALGLDEFVVVGAAERRKGLHQSASVLADVMEAVIGALYLDGGLGVAQRFILSHWAGALAGQQVVSKDAKTTLQEWALGRGLAIPAYETLSRTGPDHAPHFEVRLSVQNHAAATGQGASKRAAEMAAAAAFLAREGVR
jgi:ribonuclease-3